jgi:Zn-dependent metalloprotease
MTVIIISSFNLLLAQSIDYKKINRKHELSLFKENLKGKWNIEWDEKAGTIKSLIGDKINKYKGSVEKIAEDFFSENKNLFGIKNYSEQFILKEKRTLSSGGNCLLFNQYYEGISVLGAGYLIAINSKGEIYYLSGEFYPEIKIKTDNKIPSEYAKNIVKSNYLKIHIKDISEPIPYILPITEKDSINYKMVYEMTVFSKNINEDFVCHIDANDGSIIKTESLIKKATANGNVYQTNPLHGGIVTKTMKFLYENNPLILNGSFVHSDNYGSDPQSYDGNFFYHPDNPFFDAVMVYYHLNEFGSILRSRGLPNDKTPKIRVITNNPFDQPQSLYNLSTQEIHFRRGDNYFNNPTHDASIVCHEYGHHILKQYNLQTSTSESRSMDEAYSDYFASTYITQFGGSPIIGEYYDKPGDNFYPARNLSNNYGYNTHYGILDVDNLNGNDYYDNSMIFSGALWDFRASPNVPDDIADRLIIKSLDYLDSNPTFIEGRDAIRAAMYELNIYQYQDDLFFAFYNHEIWRPTSLEISGPTTLNFGGIGLYTPLILGDYGNTTFQWIQTFYGQSFQYLSTDDNVIIIGDGRNFDLELAVNEDLFSQHLWDMLSVTSSMFKVKADSNIKKPELLPIETVLYQNFPNPFNPTTQIKYSIKKPGNVTLRIFNAIGEKVITLVDEFKDSGTYSVNFNASQLPGGVYIYSIDAPNYRKVIKMTVLK